jgi:hypothetical protein
MIASATVGVFSSAGAADARAFSPAPHAGTLADPWPGSAIVSAILSLPASGGTVLVADGIWQFNSSLSVLNQNNVSLVGNSTNAHLLFTGAGQLNIGREGTSAIQGLLISSLTIDANNLPSNNVEVPFWVWNCQGCVMTGTTILGNANGSVPAVEFIGGINNSIIGNSVVGFAGGPQLQLNPLADGTDSQFNISQNTIDSANLYFLGLSNTQVTQNHLTNKTLGNTIAIYYCGGFDYQITGVLIDGNTIDASNSNSALISALPNELNGNSLFNDVTISNNVITGTVARIAVQNYDPDCLLNCPGIGEKYNTVIIGNTLTSAWTGSTINLQGGTTGLVDGVWVAGNTLIGNGLTPNTISQDAHTYEVTIGVNSGL